MCVGGGDEAGPPPAPPAGSRRCVPELIHRERGRCLPPPPAPPPTHPPARAAAAATAPPRSPAGPRHGGGRGGLRGGGRRREGAEDGFARAPRAGRRPLAPRRPASPSPGGCSPARAGTGGGPRHRPERSGDGGTEPAGCGGAREAGMRAARKCMCSLEVGRWMVERGMVSILFSMKPISIAKPQIPFLRRNDCGQHLRRCARTATRGGERRHACVTSQWCSAVRAVLHHRCGKGMDKILINVMQQFPRGCSRSCCMQRFSARISPRSVLSGCCCINLHLEWGGWSQEFFGVLDPAGSVKPGCCWVSAGFVP